MMKFPMSNSWRYGSIRVGGAYISRTKVSGWNSTRSFSSAASSSTTVHSSTTVQPSIQLFKYAICPFCNQVKAVLDFIKLDYEAIEVNPLTKAEISWSRDYRKVPIAILKDENNDGDQPKEQQQSVLKGSDVIVAALLQHPNTKERWPTVVANIRHNNKNNKTEEAVSLQEFQSSPASLQWIQFAKDDLAALLYPNLCPTWSDSYQAFGYIDHVPTFGTFQKVAIKSVGSLAMYMAASRVKRKRNITNAQEALRQALIVLEENGLDKGSKDFVSGQAYPNLGDVTLFGTLRSVEGLAIHERVLNEHASLKTWYGRMKEFV